jgi:hypothetical protein
MKYLACICVASSLCSHQSTEPHTCFSLLKLCVLLSRMFLKFGQSFTQMVSREGKSLGLHMLLSFLTSVNTIDLSFGKSIEIPLSFNSLMHVL